MQSTRGDFADVDPHVLGDNQIGRTVGQRKIFVKVVQHYTHRRLDDDMRAMMVRSFDFLDLIKPRKSDHHHTIIISS